MHSSTPKVKLTTRELVLFASLAGIMFLSKIGMQWIPNVHFLGMFLASFTLCYRTKALIPLYVFILLDGVYWGFSIFWVPNLYIWLPLWLCFMIIGIFKIHKKIRVPLYMILCAFHGLAFGTMYAPFQAFMFGLNMQGMIAWIIAGIPFDIIHGVGNFVAGSLIVPLTGLLKKLNQIH
ncbi:MAG: hypothetical protein FWE25_07255 [Lachnospiraceae bacterium]|nr:hypothetical protein [Lachnospiraceae bacterium]